MCSVYVRELDGLRMCVASIFDRVGLLRANSLSMTSTVWFTIYKMLKNYLVLLTVYVPKTERLKCYLHIEVDKTDDASRIRTCAPKRELISNQSP